MIVDEILALRDDAGMIHAARVLDWAQANPESKLHRQFEWDDSKAAREWRLHQARRLIAIYVVDDTGLRSVISLVADRKDGGGYRDLQSVLSNEEMRRIAVRQALQEFNRVRARYEHLRELASIHDAIVETEARIAGATDEVALPLAAASA